LDTREQIEWWKKEEARSREVQEEEELKCGRILRMRSMVGMEEVIGRGVYETLREILVLMSVQVLECRWNLPGNVQAVSEAAETTVADTVGD